MKLIDLINSLENINDDLIIFQEQIDNFDSDIMLFFAEDGGEKEYEGKKYYYLIEVFLAKEFIQDWVSTLDYRPSSLDIAKRLYNYATNDA